MALGSYLQYFKMNELLCWDSIRQVVLSLFFHLVAAARLGLGIRYREYRNRIEKFSGLLATGTAGKRPLTCIYGYKF